MRLYLFIWIICGCGEWQHLQSIESEEKLARSIQAHLTIRDYSAAVRVGQKALVLYPQSILLYEGYIRSLVHMGEEKIFLSVWNQYVECFPDRACNRELIEEMAWGVLQKAANSPSIIMREMALLAAFFSQDAKGVVVLKRGMRDSNYAVRALAVKLASQFRDYQLVEEVKRLFKEEKVWSVRQQVLAAIGKMKIIDFKVNLELIIASDETLATEKALAMTSLLEILDHINQVEIEKLSSSNRAGLRELACQAIAYFQSIRDLDRLLKLAKDSHPDVRLQAFYALGQLRPDKNLDEILILARQGIKDLNYQVALSAAWLLTLYLPHEGQAAIERFLHHERREIRIAAAAALALTGSYGLSATLNQFHEHQDPFVRLNLALGLIKQRQSTQEASLYLSQMIITEREKWSMIEKALFRAIVPRVIKNVENSLTTPEVEDQLIRLELLNLLAILKTPCIQQVIRQYLSERSWDISATAMISLLVEGDEAAADIVRQLLQDDQPRIRLQAALFLSMWSREESSIQVLERGYTASDWELKARILEGLGRIGSIRSIPFLIQALGEHSQTLRLIAAMALIQCLNH